MEGAGQVEGKILKTLWSRMEEIAGLSQSMSIAHHQEMVDEHINDNNWQKTIQMGIYLLLRFNLMRVEIHELRPKMVTEDDEVLVHYRSRTNVTLVIS